MKLGRQHALLALIATAVGAAVIWVALHTEWVEVQVPDPIKGPALRDPDYRLKQLATRLGAVVSAPENLDQLPPPGATLVLSSVHWNIFPERVPALQRWVESGGHLWLPYQGEVDDQMAWIPVKWVPFPRGKAAEAPPAAASAQRGDGDGEDTRDEDADDEETSNKDGGDEETDDEGGARDDTAPAAAQAPSAAAAAAAVRCPRIAEPSTAAPAFGARRSFASCLYARSTLRAGVVPQWELRGPRGAVVARVPLGRGSVTVASAYMPWHNNQLLVNENALLAAATLRLHPGQQLWFVREEARPRLLSFLWSTGVPAVLLGALALAFALWRGAVRFGPRAAVLPTARRSVAEQIRGTADFVAHHGAQALHAAQLRALFDAARPRIHGFDAMILGERAQGIARAAHLDANALARALNPELNAAFARHPRPALALIESARRRLLNSSPSPDDSR
jgi:hypothetical protein